MTEDLSEILEEAKVSMKKAIGHFEIGTHKNPGGQSKSYYA